MAKENIERNCVDLYLSLNEILKQQGKEPLSSFEDDSNKPAKDFIRSARSRAEEEGAKKATKANAEGFDSFTYTDYNKGYVDELDSCINGHANPSTFKGKIEVSLDGNEENIIIRSCVDDETFVYDNSQNSEGDKKLVDFLNNHCDMEVSELAPKRSFEERGNVYERQFDNDRIYVDVEREEPNRRRHDYERD